MQPHTGAALCVFSFLIPDLEKHYFPKKDAPPRKYIFPYTEFSVSSEVPEILHKQSYKTYAIKIESFFGGKELELSIGQNWHCYLKIRIDSFSPGDIRLELNHSHSGPTEKIRLLHNEYMGQYRGIIRKDSAKREALMITVPRDVQVEHALEGEVALTQAYDDYEGGQDSRIVQTVSYDRPVKETNPSRKFAFKYVFKIERAASPNVDMYDVEVLKKKRAEKQS